MTETPLRIAFMGSGAIAVPVLKALAGSSRFVLCAVITQPDKEAGRKRILTPTPLGRFADENGIPCMRVKSVNTEETMQFLREAAPDLIVVISFGQILKEPVLVLPRLGCLNVHASLLPKYRGASPIISCLVDGEKETGVAFMKMEKGLDTGPVYEIHRLSVSDDVTADVLEQQLAELAAERIEACILNLAAGTAVAHPQSPEGTSYAAKIAKSDGLVNWKDDAEVIERKIRAYNKWPSVTCRVGTPERNKMLKMISALCTKERVQTAKPGEITGISKDCIMIACGSGTLLLKKVIPEGKKEMSVADYLNGSPLAVGDVLLNGEQPVRQ